MVSERIAALLRQLVGLTVIASLFESLLPGGGVFRTAKIGVTLWTMTTLLSNVIVILSGHGG